VGEDSILYIFDALSGILENVLEMSDGREVCQPVYNLLPSKLASLRTIGDFGSSTSNKEPAGNHDR
jgi:hypothetical protein